MGFWKNEFLNERRKEWLKTIDKFQYRVGKTWYDADVNTKRIEGNSLVVIVSVPNKKPEGEITIDEVRIIDYAGNVAGSQLVSVKRTLYHGILTKYEFPIQEV